MNYIPSGLRFARIGIWIFLLISPAQAQITSDGTLALPTAVKSNNNHNFIITNGTQLGSNLFHSFQEFSIPTSGSAIFDVPSSIVNIFGRVTGNQSSFIGGLLKVTGQANLFFLNPNGIIFGQNATLDINGSFLATTAQAIRFSNGQVFSATPSPTDLLLTISVPVGLQFGTRANGIAVQRSVLSLPSKQTLGLVSGDLSLTRANLSASGGRIELGSVGISSEVKISQNVQGYALNYEKVQDFQDIRLSQGSFIDVTDLAPFFGGIEVGSGAIQVFGRKLILTDGSLISSFTFGEKSGKPLIINTSESVELLGTGNLVGSSRTTITSSGLTTITYGNGNAGDINITAPKLTLRDGGAIATRTELIPEINPKPVGNSGNLIINAPDSVILAGSSPLINGSGFIFSGLSLETQTAGNAGDLSLTTGLLTLTGGAGITAQTISSGQGGNLNITASKSVNLTGQGTDIAFAPDGTQTFFTSPSSLTVTSQGSGKAGNLSLTTPHLTVTNNAEITASSFNIGNGGNLEINANQIELNNQGKLLASSEGTGQAGNLDIQADQLTLDNGSKITVSSLGTGNAGNLNIKANNIFLDNQSQLIAETATGEGGNITLDLSEILLLRNNSLISATAGTEGGGGDGGNIDINAKFVVGFAGENSDIIANAFTGQGGNIQINALGIFGIEPRESLTPLSDITASSTFGQFGLVSINRVDVDPQSSLLTLPAEVIDPRDLIVQACAQGGEFSQGEFYVTGRGGLPTNPQQNLEVNTGLTNLGYPGTNGIVSPESSVNNPAAIAENTRPIQPQAQTIVEAQGWFRNSHGKIVLTAQAAPETANPGEGNPPTCHDLSKYFSIRPLSSDYSVAR
jgi:filamentous hemagglutinin family protein